MDAIVKKMTAPSTPKYKVNFGKDDDVITTHVKITKDGSDLHIPYCYGSAINALLEFYKTGAVPCKGSKLYYLVVPTYKELLNHNNITEEFIASSSRCVAEMTARKYPALAQYIRTSVMTDQEAFMDNLEDYNTNIHSIMKKLIKQKTSHDKVRDILCLSCPILELLR